MKLQAALRARRILPAAPQQSYAMLGLISHPDEAPAAHARRTQTRCVCFTNGDDEVSAMGRPEGRHFSVKLPGWRAHSRARIKGS